MPHCFVPGCKNSHKTRAAVSYHSFPKSMEKIWLKRIGRDENITIIHQRVCSDHFCSDELQKFGALHTLKANSIPSLKLSMVLSSENQMVTYLVENELVTPQEESENEAQSENENSASEVDKVKVDEDHSYEKRTKQKQNSKANKTKQRFLDKNSFCRICLKSTKQRVKFEKPIRNMIIDCVPFMEPFVTDEHFLCLECLPKLQTSYFFTHACLKAKEIFMAEYVEEMKKESAENQIEVVNLDGGRSIFNEVCFLTNEINAGNSNEKTDVKNEPKDDVNDDHDDKKCEPNVEAEETPSCEVIIKTLEENKLELETFGKSHIQCPNCQEIFTIEGFLATHTKTCEFREETAAMMKGCKQCHLVLHISKLDAHLEKEHHSFHCKTCKVNFESQELLNTHISKLHDYLCTICNKRQDTEERFLAHLNSHNRLLRNREKVSKILEERNLPAIEIRKEVKKKKKQVITKEFTVCYVCGISLHVHTLKSHMEVHDDRLVSCKICNQSMKKLSLKNHTRQMHGPKSHICDICGRAFRKHANMMLHKKSHITEDFNLKCNLCEKTFLTKSRLYYHGINVHKNKYKCVNCYKRFAKQTSYETHIQRNDCREKILARPKSTKKYPHVPAQCTICFKVLVNKQTLQYHMETHIGTSATCNKCGKTYKHAESLARHMKYHQKRYVCNFCGLVSSSAGNLARHRKTHNDVKPHRCGVCWERFYTLEELNGHGSKHDDNKKHECNSCGEKFNRRYLLECHVNEVHLSENIMPNVENVIVFPQLND